MATKVEMYSATHESVTVARGQRQENTDRVKNQSDCRIRYRAILKKNNLRYYSCHANIKFMSIFFFIVLLLFGKCIYIFVVYHNKSRGHLIIPYHEQAKFIQKSLKWRELKRRRSISRPLMLHNKNTPLGPRMWWS